VSGQQALKKSRVLVVGLGGLGSPVTMYLAASGVGHLVLVDFDYVELSNLQRQPIHDQHSVGQSKVASAKAAVERLNVHVEVETVEQKVADSQWHHLLNDVDVVVDCTDNFSTRFALNAACYKQKVPLVSGAAIRLEGQLTVFDPRKSASPCYQCLYSPQNNDELNCSESGVISPLVGVMGSLQALEVIKVVSNIGETLVGRLVLFDAKSHRWRELQLPKDPHCAICGESG